MMEQTTTKTTTQLRVRFDGDVPGLAEHRLSLAAFGHPLALLLQALRRIATQMATNADGAEHPKRGGRFANLAKQLDIEVTSIEGSSSGIDAIVSFAFVADELPLLMDLGDRATIELLESIENESRGVPRNWAARKYLASLPKGVNKQLYELHHNGDSRKRVEIGSITIPEVPDLPSLMELEGSVIGVGFDPGRSEVRIKAEDSNLSPFGATDEQVNEALLMRNATVRALGVSDGKRTRLLALSRASSPRFKMTPEDVEKHIFGRWSGVFARLAK
jgi:hypothetical protein